MNNIKEILFNITYLLRMEKQLDSCRIEKDDKNITAIWYIKQTILHKRYCYLKRLYECSLLTCMNF